MNAAFRQHCLVGLAGLATLLGASCASHEDKPDGPRPDSGRKVAYELTEDVRYVPEDWPEPLGADLYLPASTGLRPAVLVVHGGGWTRRSRSDMNGISRQLAKRGFVVLNVTYRFAPAYRHPAQLEDLREALAWLAANADEHRIDVTRIGAFGYSAGAHLAALVAVTDPEPGVAAVVAGGTPVDLRKWPDSPLVNTLIGAHRDAALEAWTDASPIAHVTPDDPPFFLYHGGMDTLVEPEQATLMQAALQEVGVPVELYLAPLQGHVSMFVFGGSAVRAGIDFLARELALD
ncbi:MAG: alpha/beta hydrolase [Pseudomonadota bacterium]